ncbi:fibrocystin-L [Camelus ferus]|nr:fibrocystin-L [Camelus ferus]
MLFISARLDFQKTRYYIEILLQEYRLSAFVDVGLYQYRNVYTEQQTEDAVNEEQVIKSQSTIVQEVQEHINRGQKTAETDAYCGRYSLKNPAVLFDSADVKPNRLPYGDILLFPYNQLCLAYKGFLANYIGLKFQYQDTRKITRSTDTQFTYNFAYGNNWTYTCIDLLDLIQTKYAGTNFSLQRISLQKASESQSFYVDIVYIGQTSTIATLHDNEIKCQVLNGSAGHFPVAVSVADVGLARSVEEEEEFRFIYHSQISHILPASGSLAGGTLLTLSGFGFNENSEVLVGNETCNIIEGDLNKITCRTPKRTEGAVDISVITSGFEATAKNAYSYNCLQTPVIIDFSPKVRTTLGEVNLTIKGYNFENELTQNMEVYVGGKACQVLHWNFTDVRCLLPKLSPGKHDIYVEVRNWGFASTRDKLNASIRYILEVTNMFPQKGSLYGGTEITIMGLGFSTIPAENTVLLGSFPCHVTSSSENVIKCILHSTGNVFRITNDGEDSGSFSYQFTSPGIHYYSSGYVDEARSIFLQGVINVLPAETRHVPLHLFVGGSEATYAPGGPVNLHLGSSVAGCLATEPLCGLNNTEVKNSNRLLFELSSCFSPSISNISPSTGTVNELITITGHGFSNLTCANKVTIGSYPCVVEESSNNFIVCHIDSQNSMVVGIREIVRLTVYNLGTAINTLSNEFDRRFVLLPNIDMVLPNAGSTTGMTKVTVKGSGFAGPSAGVRVLMGHSPCSILSVNYTAIECETSPAPQQLVKVSLLIHGVPAQCQGNCSFSYLESITPSITRVSPYSITGSAQVLIEGEGFGALLEDISVFIGNQQFRAIDVNENNITVLVTPLPAGLYSLSVVVGTKGLALGNLTVHSPAVASVTPASGSIGGGTTLVITGNGFYPGNTTVTVGDEPCQIISVSSSEVCCRTPAGTAGTVSVKISVNAVAYPPLSFTYALEDTPLLRGIVPSTGPPGTEIQITGSNFGTDILEISVAIDNIQCNVTMVNDTVLQCITGDHAGGTFPVMMHHKTKGSAVSTVVFEYPLSTQNIHPSQGSFGGGQTMTVTGTGFNPQNSVILVCGSKCAVDRLASNSTTLLCEIPPNDGGGPEQRCEVSVVHGKNLSRSTTPFTYTMSLTPLITKIAPQRGSTAGGTRLTVLGAGFSENIQDVLVTIAEARCDVEYSNKTYLICTTNAHSPSGWASVRVSIRGIGVAKLDNADFLYIDSWSSSFSWGGKSPPEEGSLAVITKGQTILLDQNTPILKMLLIQGGTLIFDEADIELQAENILITDGGVLQIGTEASPFQHKAIITLHGHLRSPELPVYGAKTLAVREGILDLHGEFATQTCLQGKFGEEIGSDQFGGCIMFHAPVPGANLVTGRLEHVEIFHAGQAFRLGRYPIHWHLLGDLQFKSYVRGCAIHQTYNRAVTIHNTHHLLVERNIIYDIRGGAFFIEDGIEHGNILQYNLAVFVQQSTSLLNDDVTPAAFWVTNPNNTIRHNAAAGGTHFGFWYRMNNHPDGPSYDRNICQKRVPLGEFFNNTVHSQGWFGLWIFEEYFPMQTGSCTSTVPVPAIFNSLTTWNCQKGAEWVNGGALQFHNFVMVNNQEAGIETKRILAPYVGGWGETNGAVIKNAKIVGHLDELGTGSAFCTRKGLVLPFSEGLTVSSVHFMNFDRPRCVALGVTSITGICNDRCGGWSAKFVDIQYSHTPNKAGFRWEHEVVLIDVDGSLTGHKGHTVIPHSSLLDPSHCTQEAEWSIGFAGSVCDALVSFHRLAFNKPSPVSLLEKDVVLSDSFGTWIVADTDIPPMERLIIWGVLELEDKHNVGATGSSYGKVVLNATYISLQEGEEIVITTTSYDFHQTETRSIVKILHDHKLLILNDTLSYTHLAQSYHVPATGQSYTLAADVGILSRNIKILGEDYPGWFKESFGARVLVSSFTENAMTFKGSTFVGFKNVCSGETSVIFITNPLNEDLQHPIHVKNIQLVDTTEQSKIFIHRPDVSKVNPSDCVDMVCDAKRKSLLRDMDGSFLGNSGSVIPEAEYEWNGNSQFGIGDYRIPKVMLSFPNGSRIPITEKAPYKGIIRDSTCKYIPEWQSYRCFGMEHAMMVIESLDSDTETRRLSPVAIVGNGYVDLINGPQDHGWCAGYTCRRRLSLFHSIVALGKFYEVYFTGTSPQNLRLMLLNVDHNQIPSDKIRVSKIIRGENLRRKRALGLTVELEIGDPPPQFVINNTTGQMQLSELQKIADSLGQAVILGKTRSILGFNISSMSITNPIPSPSDSGWIKVTAQPVERLAFPVHHVAFVSSLSVITQPAATQPGQPFSQQPSVKAVDSDGNCVSVEITSLTLKAVLKDSNNNQISGLSGNTTVPFSGCWANYTDLTLLRTGKNLKIEFVLDDTVRAESRAFSLAAHSVSGGGGYSKAPAVGTAAQMVTTVGSCLMGRLLLSEIFTTAVLILNVTPDVEEWTSWDEDAPTSVKIEGGNGNVAAQQNALEQLEPDYFKDMTPTIRKTQKIIIKKREPLNFGIPDGSTGFSSRLAATQDMPFIHQSAAEDSRQRKESSRAAKEEDGKGSTAANEEGTEQNWCETFITSVLHMS